MTVSQHPTEAVVVSRAELERRWHALRQLLDIENVEAIVVQNSNDFLGGHVRWLTGVAAAHAYPRSVIFFRDRPMVVIEQGAFRSHRMPSADHDSLRGVADWFGSPSYSSVPYTAHYDAEIAVREIQRANVRRVALINPSGMYYPFAQYIVDRLDTHRIVDLTNQVDRLKAVKSSEEITAISATAALQDAVIQAVTSFVQPGMKECEVTAYAQYTAQRLGSEQGIFLIGSAPLGRAATYKGRQFQTRVIGPGDGFTLLVEVNGPGGYYTEIGRCFVFGKAPAELSDAVAHVVEAQEQTLRHLIPGARCRDIFARHNAFMASRGLPEEDRLHCHGQGFDMVERPLIRRDEDMEILAGMNIVVHPGYVTPSIFATICDNFIIGPDGPLPRLHKTPQGIIEL
ncbi:M24 family metallopeptidase [Paraburkholderia nemoris]|uniref:M24 family metallopeptidase n=1 Tax=Paraburkholderia nemoris TaxID=2793076 RepID=UPI0038B8171F